MIELMNSDVAKNTCKYWKMIKVRHVEFEATLGYQFRDA